MGQRYEILIPDYRPLTLNQLMATFRKRQGSRKRSHYQIIWGYSLAVPRATGRRRVSLEIGLGPRQRGADPDAYWKVILDGLVRCRLLLDDNRQGVEHGPVTFDRGEKPWVEIVLEDLE